MIFLKENMSGFPLDVRHPLSFSRETGLPFLCLPPPQAASEALLRIVTGPEFAWELGSLPVKCLPFQPRPRCPSLSLSHPRAGPLSVISGKHWTERSSGGQGKGIWLESPRPLPHCPVLGFQCSL